MRLMAAAVAALVALGASSAEARTKKRVRISYETEYGRSKPVRRVVDFFAGSEIEPLAARRAGIKYSSNYAGVWFSQTEVALIRLRGFTWFGEATAESVDPITPWRGEDQSGTQWRIESDLLCPPEW